MKVDTEALIKKTYEIVGFLYSKGQAGRKELNEFLDEHYEKIEKEIIDGAIMSTGKFEKIGSNPGGFAFIKGKNLTRKLTESDKSKIATEISNAIANHQNKRERKQDELAVLEAFKNFIRTENPNILVDFKQNARAGGQWENIDGYKMEVYQSQYHLSFNPILTAFEVKKEIPSKKDISQARDYSQFSHFVYLVFKDHRSEKEIMDYLHSLGFGNGTDEKDNYIGIYYTSDLISFCEVKPKKVNKPSMEKIDQQIDKLLSKEHKVRLQEMMAEHLRRLFREIVTTR